MLSYAYNGESPSQAAIQMLLSRAFAREPFPRSQGRGSIEAERGIGGSIRHGRCFHVRKDVAPLKPGGQSGAAMHAGRFHVRKDVAPLKLHET
jgi:hypothetical protein